MKTVTAGTLDNAVELDVPFTLVPHREHNADNQRWAHGAVRATKVDVTDLYAPEVNVDATVDEYGDAHVTGDAWIDQPMKMFTNDRWSFYSHGYTGQFGVKRNDPVMHPSEYVGGRLAQDMINDGGTFVITVVRMLPDSEEYDGDDLIGWVVLRKDED